MAVLATLDDPANADPAMGLIHLLLFALQANLRQLGGGLLRSLSTTGLKREMSWRKAAPDAEAAHLSDDVAVCDVILVEARSRIRIGKFDARLNELVALAGEILDDLDAVLVKLNPSRDASQFAAAARLHRDLEQVQSAIPSSNRNRPAPQVRARLAALRAAARLQPADTR